MAKKRIRIPISQVVGRAHGKQTFRSNQTLGVAIRPSRTALRRINNNGQGTVSEF